MIKYACDMKEDSPYRALSRAIKRISTCRAAGLGASSVLLAMAWITRSGAIIFLWMAFCLAVLLVCEILQGNIFRDMRKEEQEGFTQFLEQFKTQHRDWEPDGLGYAYRSGKEDCVPVLCYFGETELWELGRILKKYFIAYVSGRMIYAYRFEDLNGARPKVHQRKMLAWETAEQPHQQYLRQEAERCGRYLAVENFIYDMALANMIRGRPNQPCNTVTALRHMRKEPVYLAEIGGGEVLAVPGRTGARVNIR